MPTYRVQKTTPAFCEGTPDMRWHVMETSTSRVLAFRHTRREAQEFLRQLLDNSRPVR